MKDRYLQNFKEKSKEELLHIIEHPIMHDDHAITAAHELLRKKTATFSEYQKLTKGKTNFSKTAQNTSSTITSEDDTTFLSAFLTVLKWMGIVAFFPLSLMVVGYYKQKKAKKEYYARNRPQHKR